MRENGPAESDESRIATPPSRRGRLLVLLLSPLIGLIVLEVALRVIHDGFGGLAGWLYMAGGRSSFDDIDDLSALIASAGQPIEPFAISNDFVLNSRGLRTVEYADAKAPGSKRIVVLGDSHSWASGGMPYLDLWHSRVRAGLAAATGHEVELINLSVPAVGPEFEQRMWTIEGARLRPDVVILALSVGNDFLEVETELADRTVLDRVARRAYVVRLFRNFMRLKRLLGLESGRAPHAADVAIAPDRKGGFVRPGAKAVYDRSAPKYSVEAHHQIIGARTVISDTTPEASAQFETAAARIGSILHALNVSVKEHGASLVVLLIPDEHQLDEPLLAALATKQHKTRADFDVDRPQRTLRAMCAKEGILCVDGLEALRKRATTVPMFNLREAHLNDFGHAILADLVIAAFVENRLLSD